MLGLEKGCVKLHPHNEQWHRLFFEEKAILQAAIGEFVLAIEHIGSTSVCGISAKPILDIAIALGDKDNGEKCVARLEAIGYEYRGENGIAERFYFVKGAPRTHHIHMLSQNSDALKNHLLFRNYLRQNPTTAKEYDKLKKELAQKHQNDRDTYLDGKAEFIERVLSIARL